MTTIPSAAYLETMRADTLTKFFTHTPHERITPMPQPPTAILVVTEARLLLLPGTLLAQVQACEKAYAGGRWYIVTPAALWASLTRLLG